MYVLVVLDVKTPAKLVSLLEMLFQIQHSINVYGTKPFGSKLSWWVVIYVLPNNGGWVGQSKSCSIKPVARLFYS